MFFDKNFGHNVLTYHLYNSKKGLSITTWITTYYTQCTYPKIKTTKHFHI